jgi:hypothetical protein
MCYKRILFQYYHKLVLENLILDCLYFSCLFQFPLTIFRLKVDFWSDLPADDLLNLSCCWKSYLFNFHNYLRVLRFIIIKIFLKIILLLNLIDLIILNIIFLQYLWKFICLNNDCLGKETIIIMNDSFQHFSRYFALLRFCISLSII